MPRGRQRMLKYRNYEIYTQSPAGLVRCRAVRATSSEHAVRMAERELPEGHKIIGTVYQFKTKG